MSNLLYDVFFAPQAGRSGAFLILPDGAEISGAAFLDMVHRVANALVSCGLQPGDRIAVQIEKSPMALAIYGGAVAAGVVFLPLNTAYPAAEIDYFVGNAQPKILVADGRRADALASVAQAHAAQLMVLNADGSGSFAELVAGQSADFTPVARAADDLAAFLYTSGTTGRSKGAMLTHGNLLSNAEVLTREWQFTDKDVLLHALPIFHTHGLFVATNVALMSGAAMIFLPGLNMDDMIRLMPQATTMMGVPTFYTRLLADPRFTASLTAHMRLFISGSAPLLAETHVQFEKRTGHRILERYGMTETNMLTSNPYDGERRAGTVGMPLAGVELRIADPETGAALPQGQTGMIEVRGPNVFQGYWQMPEKTAAEFRDDGFFMTGDLGLIDDKGYVNIVGRAKDLIISGGYNIYPKEVELVLDDMPQVLESAVIGLPHADFGEAVVAVLVAAEQAPDLAAIEKALQSKLARYKQPKAYIIVPELPRNNMGKVQKAALRQQYATKFKEAAL
ncbi:malonate--CoA ligase [Yoonia vestfoldensis]|uniref:Long-chain-fatty-acid--CoA ligase n=1 Tax=Yoonia vestfoldensis TaxID=245188 RepID=A0A1Y0E9A3_9RHOB|nr:malonyl-CoA synthase [Yoonia vestfoldensis]ARU00123.1 long-chain-fatty-acid--CoA ligase [Yoonia vestfoldensis]